jgi:hypothetical protein
MPTAAQASPVLHKSLAMYAATPAAIRRLESPPE